MSSIEDAPSSDYVWSVKKVKALSEVDLMTGIPSYGEIQQLQNFQMSSITREEFDAKIETIEVRMDGRVSEILSKIDSHIARMDDREVANKDRIANISEIMKDIKSDVRSFRTTIIATTISVGVATVFGIAAFNATVLSNMVASFESGKNTAAAIGDASKRLESVQERIEAQQKKASPLPTAK